MLYYVTCNEVCISMFNSVEDVNHFLARRGYTIVNTYLTELDNCTIVEVEKW